MAAHTLHGITGASAKGFKTHVNAYVRYITIHDLSMFDSRVCHFQCYAAHLEDTHNSVDSIKNYVHGAVKLYTIMGFKVPDVTDYMYSLTIKGITRFKDHVVKRAQPLYPDMLASMQGFVNLTDLQQVVAWVAILLGFFMFFRKSNLVPDSTTKFNPLKQLCRGNLFKWGNMYFARVFWAKNIQFRERELLIPILPNPDKRICPVYWLDVMVQLIPAATTDPALSVPREGMGNVALTYPQLTKWMKLWVSQVGYDQQHFTSHSLRRGEPHGHHMRDYHHML